MRQSVGQMTIRRREAKDNVEVLHQSTSRSRFTLALEELCWWRVLEIMQLSTIAVA